MQGKESGAQQTVVRLTVGPTDTTYTSLMWKAKDRNNGHLSIGPVHVDIPQHPVTLHGIMTRSTKQITSTLMEFKGTRILYRGKTSAMDDSDLEPRLPTVGPVEEEESHLIKPLVMTFQLVIKSFAVSAALLPSLQTQYKMERVSFKGVTGSKAKFSAILPKHTLSFTTKLENTTLPSEAVIDLPQVTFHAEYMQDQTHHTVEPKKAADGSMYSKGNYFKVCARYVIGGGPPAALLPLLDLLGAQYFSRFVTCSSFCPLIYFGSGSSTALLSLFVFVKYKLVTVIAQGLKQLANLGQGLAGILGGTVEQG